MGWSSVKSFKLKVRSKTDAKKSSGPAALANCKQNFAFKFMAMDFNINVSAIDCINEQHHNSETVDQSLPRPERFVDF